ncbi:hypothetical protein DM860_016958 [Cuscuta australis]|uniref:Uncharacterized protein n=1 Tax=Cuscuta australis TaxID=267555 RepID=A0A328E224_9ASTE|nr:hypothetical protein DM860_016958 [Cuscuta australis]
MDLVTRVLLGESVLRLGMMVGLSFEDLKAQRFRVRFLALSLSLDDPPAGMPFSVKHVSLTTDPGVLDHGYYAYDGNLCTGEAHC